MDPRRHRHARNFIFVEVGGLGTAVLDLNGKADRLTDAVDDRAFDLVERTKRVDDVAADIAGSPDVVDLDLAPRTEADFDHFGEIAEVAVVEAEALGASVGRAAGPVGH